MDTVYTALVFPLLLLIGQTLVALCQRKISQRMDERGRRHDKHLALRVRTAHGGRPALAKEHQRRRLGGLVDHHVAVVGCG